ncbi:uncharacterized protein Z519_03050 [Cladophialophora bantiana CBS 173.52]|uniref:SigF-like NTF2-like domain-containing protein n=1 Tax=Cladophialophora bantiana (strain ATCC 10958 / CBS 173.52 / CDC B-1940 / NIH 8579) TaxID=1442370 RepID=A0A0D2IGW6_CLAB1|nr:uncharacterized protein Z519_03050 [Cladophialophora bantiana CBS 173.52]KIW95984.1 hypothetical protein Z519_03050 [Cladophialophora bantiana CBS 173.52]
MPNSDKNAVADIPQIIETLCTASAAVQRGAIETYFTPNASFTHPFCRTGSFPGSIWLIIMIYRWYKILSPHIDVAVDSVAFDEQHLRLYVSLHQNFKLWVVPFYNAPVKLVTVLQLTTDPILMPPDPQENLTTSVLKNGNKHGAPDSSHGNAEQRDEAESAGTPRKEADDGDSDKVKYYIQSQNDLYQTTEFIKFLIPWGVGVVLLITWQFCATLFCVVGTKVYDLLVWLPQKLYRQHSGAFDNNPKAHPHLGD